MLYAITNQQKYKEMALNVRDNVIDAQSDEGYWGSTGDDTPNNDSTAEMVVCLDEIYQAVGEE